MPHLQHSLRLWQSGQRLEAENALLELLRHSPDDVQALKSLAEVYGATGRSDQAVPIWRRLSRLLPTDAGIWRQLANALLETRALAEAIESLRTAILLDPSNARAYNNLGLAQLRGGDAAAAAAALERAVTVDPAYALAHMNLGLVRRQLGQNAAARRSYEHALRIDPHLSHARLQLSELLSEEDAAAARRERERALESHAINLMTVSRHEDAVAAWDRLIDDGADIPYLQGMRFHCRLHCCDWVGYAAEAATLEQAVRAGRPADLPFSFFVYSNSAEAQLECSRTYAANRHPPALGQSLAPVAPAAARPSSTRLRIAYVSFDFHEHATAYLLAGLLESHDPERFEIIALSYGQDDGSDMRARLEKSVERFVDVSRSTDPEVADLMRGLGIDIAVDLKGFTGGARSGIFALRAAPIQINFLGYPGTMGADYMDYIVADHHVIPEHDQIHYSEKIIYMPDCYQPNDVHRPLPVEAPPRQELGLPQAGFVFCCFNNLYKITPAVFDTWMHILRNAGGAVLWLLAGVPAAMRNLRAAAAAAGVAPERIVFAPHVALAQHLARYRHADLFLDTSPCNAHTTASDALWMGVPVLTLTGAAFPGRVATSLLHAVGLPRLCTASLPEYAEQALRLAKDPSELEALEGHLESGRRSFALFDTGRYCRHIEAAYEAIWRRHAAGEAPRTLIVA